MGIWISNFKTTATYEAAEATLVKPHVSLTKDNMQVHYKPVPPHDYSQDYLTFKALSQGTMTIYHDEIDGSPTTISYSTDDGTTWTQITTSAEPYTIGTFNVGDKLLLKGNNSSYYVNTLIGGTAMLEVCGNIMSMLYGDNFVGQTTLTENSTFETFFYGNTNLISAENLILPATTLANSCYGGMFQNCTSLTTAPELPATTLAYGCYNSMFYGCISLTTAPELPATTLASDCYSNMFYDCTSLTTAPELHATTLTSSCYGGMFYDCTSLTTAPELPATTLAYGCYASMFSGCTSLTTAPQLPATTLAERCYQSMFSNCTSLTTAPELPATTLANNCYSYMFRDCTSLNYIKAMFTTTPSTSYTNNWVNGVASSGTFVKNAAATWNVTGVNGVPSGWTVTTAHDYVDLGLPSGTKWATMNVGASSETDYGNYYQYGKGAAQYAATSGQSDYSGTEDPLDSSVDTAAQVWGGSWHMPTRAQMQELTANTTYQWVTNYKGSGINGGTFAAANGAVLFLPAAGLWLSGRQSNVGNSGLCWGSSPSGGDSAYGLYFGDGYKGVDGRNRKRGYSVRPVVG